MSISETKTRTLLTLEKTLKKEAETMAKKENRSLNNLIETALMEYIKNTK